ncbi:hypothetical protein SALBM311S_01156 [Streptomyces alboniger]
MDGNPTYQRIIDLLDTNGARYSLIEHPAEGHTEKVSSLRGNHLEQAAKCIVVRVGITKKKGRYVLAVVPGDRRVNTEAVRSHYDGVKAMFAPGRSPNSWPGLSAARSPRSPSTPLWHCLSIPRC